RRQVRSRQALFVADAAVFPKVRRSLQDAPGKRLQFPALAPCGPEPPPSEFSEDVMNLQISRRGKQYLQTAQTLLRSAQTMTDSVVASQLRALAEDYERRAEKASHDDAAKILASAAARAEQANAW